MNIFFNFKSEARITALSIGHSPKYIHYIEKKPSKALMGRISFSALIKEIEFNGLISSPSIKHGIKRYLFELNGELKCPNSEHRIAISSGGLFSKYRWNFLNTKSGVAITGHVNDQANFILQQGVDQTALFKSCRAPNGEKADGEIDTDEPTIEMIAAILIIQLAVRPNERHSIS